MTPVEIEKNTGVKRPRAYYWLGKLNLRPHRRHRDELTARQRRQIQKAFSTGEPLVGIARRFGVSFDQVRYAVKGMRPDGA
jgi:DNA invertase Pin-like site-specific DNA recombinase